MAFLKTVFKGAGVIVVVLGALRGGYECAFGDGGLLHRKAGSTCGDRFENGFVDGTWGAAKNMSNRLLGKIETTNPKDIEDAARRTKHAAEKVGGAVADGLSSDAPQP